VFTLDNQAFNVYVNGVDISDQFAGLDNWYAPKTFSFEEGNDTRLIIK
jgi:hypothetical protein